MARIDRILSQGPEPLRVAVRGGGNRVSVGEVVRADAESALLRFPSVGAPRYEIGEGVKLSLSSPGLADTIELRARVTSRGEAESRRTYGFALRSDGGAEREMARALLDLIGRRGAYRATLDADESREVRVLSQVRGEPREFLGVLLDVSTGGLRLVLKAGAERHLAGVDALELRFSLPGEFELFTLAVSIRHRSECDGGIAYGVRFEPDQSPDFIEQQARISEFVLGRVR